MFQTFSIAIFTLSFSARGTAFFISSAVLLQWLPGKMIRPHFHPNDRFFIVVSGTWWVGSGPEFKPDATVPMPAGSHVIHYAKGVHFDGAKDEHATILVWGEGPATTTPFGTPPVK